MEEPRENITEEEGENGNTKRNGKAREKNGTGEEKGDKEENFLGGWRFLVFAAPRRAQKPRKCRLHSLADDSDKSGPRDVGLSMGILRAVESDRLKECSSLHSKNIGLSTGVSH